MGVPARNDVARRDQQGLVEVLARWKGEDSKLYWDSATEVPVAFVSHFDEFADDFYGSQIHQSGQGRLSGWTRQLSKKWGS